MFTKKGPNYNEKVERNRAIFRLKSAYPKIPFKMVGFIFDMSGAAAQKIYQRVKREGSQTEKSGI
jgi:hypothetical protein